MQTAPILFCWRPFSSRCRRWKAARRWERERSKSSLAALPRRCWLWAESLTIMPAHVWTRGRWDSPELPASSRRNLFLFFQRFRPFVRLFLRDVSCDTVSLLNTAHQLISPARNRFEIAVCQFAPHCSRALPVICFQLPSILSQFICQDLHQAGCKRRAKGAPGGSAPRFKRRKRMCVSIHGARESIQVVTAFEDGEINRPLNMLVRDLRHENCHVAEVGIGQYENGQGGRRYANRNRRKSG